MRRVLMMSVVFVAALSVAVLAGMRSPALASAAGRVRSAPVHLAGGAPPVASPTPTLSVATTSPVLEQVGSTWTTSVTVGYSGPALTSDLKFVMVVTSPTLPASTTWPTDSQPALAPGTAAPVTLTFKPTFAVIPASAELVIETTPPSPQASPVTITLLVQRQIGFWHEVGLPLVAGLVLVLLFLSLTLRHTRKASGTPHANSTWSFKDSWATNIIAAGAVLCAVITETGAVASAFPGVPLYRFSMLFAAFGGITAIAPLVVGLASTRTGPAVAAGGAHQGEGKATEAHDDAPEAQQGAHQHDAGHDGAHQLDAAPQTIGFATWSLLTGQSLTMLAVAGELTSLALLVWWSSAPETARWLLIAAIVLSGLVVLVYAVKATVSLYPKPADATAVQERVFGFSFGPTEERAAAL